MLLTSTCQLHYILICKSVLFSALQSSVFSVTSSIEIELIYLTIHPLMTTNNFRIMITLKRNLGVGKGLEDVAQMAAYMLCMLSSASITHASP